MHRRDLLRLSARALLAAPAAALAVPAAGYLLGAPARTDKPLVRVRLVTLDNLAEGVTRIEYDTASATRFAWVRRHGGEVTVFSPVCPHAGCLVNWQEAKFVCLCHQSEFAADGAWISGPSLDNLQVIESEMADGVLWISVQE